MPALCSRFPVAADVYCISIYADNADPAPAAMKAIPPLHLPTCNAFPFKEWGAAASCFIEKGLNMSIRPRERKAGKWNIGAHLARIGCPSSCRLYQDRCATNEVFAQSATVRPTVLARWIRTIEEKEKEGRRERQSERCDEVVTPLPFPAPPSVDALPSAVLLLLLQT